MKRMRAFVIAVGFLFSLPRTKAAHDQGTKMDYAYAEYDNSEYDSYAQTEGDTGYEEYDDDNYDSFDYSDPGLGLEPEFDAHFTNLSYVVGDTAILPCRVKNRGNYQVSWSSPDKVFLTMDDQRTIDDGRFDIMRSVEEEWNLQLRKVLWEDRGTYKCTVNYHQPKSKLVNLSVRVPATIIDELSSGDATVEEGATVILNCNVTGVPYPTVSWYRRRFNSISEDEREKIVNSTGEALIIPNVTRYCDDIYECVADNGVSAVSRQMRVTVEFEPEISLPASRFGQITGKTTMLECRITARPQGETVWKKNGRIVNQKTDKRYQLHAYEYEQSPHTISVFLTIKDVKKSDSGVYECFSTNPLGNDSEKMVFTVKPKPNETLPKRSSQEPEEPEQEEKQSLDFHTRPERTGASSSFQMSSRLFALTFTVLAGTL